MSILDSIIQESINDCIDSIVNEEAINEISKSEKLIKKNAKRAGKGIKDMVLKNKDTGKNTRKSLNRLDAELNNKKSRKPKKEKEVSKNAKKLKNGLRTDFNVKQDRLTNPNLNNQDSEDLSDILDNPAIDLAAIAKKIYPDHTAEGAQSQLRKKVKGLKSDSGSKYKIKKKEAYKLRRILSNLL